MGACCSCQRGGNFEGFFVEGEEHERDVEEENIVLTRDAGARVRMQGSSKYVSMFSQQGKKGINQDAMTVWESFSGDKDMFFCGVFDGHGPSGHKVARYIRESLPTKISSLYRQPSVDGNDCVLDVENPDGCENPDLKNPYFLSWKARLIKCFHEVDEELENEVSIESYCSGTTTVSVLKKGEHLIISNLGDSRAVLCTRNENDELIAKQLTVDLKPNLPSEAQRIRSCQGRVMAMDEEPNVYRIWMPHEDCPGLAMARAFGDFCLKDFGLISTPQVTYRKLTERDEFVVLATDGIWDVLSNNEVVRIIASSRKRSMAAKFLVDHAVRAWRYKYPRAKIDDCAVVCLFLKRQRPVLTKSVSAMSELSFNQTYSYGGSMRSDDGLDTVLNWEGDGSSQHGGNGSDFGPNRMKKRRQAKKKLENVENIRRRNQVFRLTGTSSSSWMASVVKCRNLSKNQLGGVIFGCTNNTKSECITKKLFGLPAQHFSYVKNIEAGLPLFLFNYSERKLYGIYEAVNSGKMYIDSYGWTADGSDRTRYPAQVQIRVRLECQALSETLFKPIIVDNYYSQNHFLFELDHIQASKLISKLSSLAFSPMVYTPQNPRKLLSAKQRFPLIIQRKENQAPEPPYLTDDFANSDDSFGTLGNSDDSVCLDGDNLLTESALANKNAEPEEEDLIYMKLKELARYRQYSAAAITGQSGQATYVEDVDLEHETYENGMPALGNRNNESPFRSLDSYTTIAQLRQEMEELKAFKKEQTCKIGILEKKLAEAELEIQRLGKVCMRFESMPETYMAVAATGNETPVESPDLTEFIFLVGGYDGVSWSSALHSFSPVNNVLKSHKPMYSIRAYASVAKLSNELFVFGGGDGSVLYDTVESYNPVNNQWTLRPSLNRKKGHLASASINGKIFAVGGGNGAECFSGVEMFDSDVGRWISTRSMLQKRFALAAGELNGALYAVGGYDGNDYLKSAERFDPREHSWTRIGSMGTNRGCHSLVVMNEKLYAIGGFNGTEMVPSVEIYDPRVGTWMSGEPMKQSRGYSAAAVLNESIYVIGGIRAHEDILDTIERYKEGEGWEITQSKSVGKRTFASAIGFYRD